MSDRIYYEAEPGVWRPTKKGLTCLDLQFTSDNGKQSMATTLHSGEPLVAKALRQLVPAPRCQARVRVA